MPKQKPNDIAPNQEPVRVDLQKVAAALRDPAKVIPGSMTRLFSSLCDKLRTPPTST